MRELRNKTILILSPQPWGKMFVSKHHYAVELAKRGNTVFFLNPPDQKQISFSKAVSIEPSAVHENLFLVDHKLFFPYRLKFHALGAFHFFARFQINKILKEIQKPLDIVWSFDLGNLFPLTLFPDKTYKIFHPVDEPAGQPSIEAAQGAQVIFSVTREILEKYQKFDAPKQFINHGVTSDFLTNVFDSSRNAPVRIGFSGNMLRNDIDREILLQIVRENVNCRFEFWGSYQSGQSNMGGFADGSTENFITNLKQQPNVVLHGAVSPHELATAIQNMDAFLICYDVQRDQSKGTNYHKVMEYLGTGKVIVSNNITTYSNRPDLVQMITARDNNASLPSLFRDVIAKLDTINSTEQRRNRVAFASDNLYAKQLERIEAALNGLKQ